MRKIYLDNLRAAAVLLLFPYHTFMVYNNFESFYIHGEESVVLSGFITACWPWIMPVLFAAAGIGAHAALQKRTARQFLSERLRKLLLPLLAGMALLLPIQTYLAGLFHGGAGSYWDFFTKWGNWTGYAGGFTPGHLWFLLYLLVISLLALPMVLWHRRRGREWPVANMPLWGLALLFLVPLLLQPLGDISGKSIGEYLGFFLLGYFVLSNEDLMACVQHARWIFGLPALAAFATAWLLGDRLWQINPLLYDIAAELYAWLSILALLGFFRRHANRETAFLRYLVNSSFGVYLFHQSWVVVAAYFALRWTASMPLQILLILSLSIPLTFLTYELCRRLAPTRFLFALKR